MPVTVHADTRRLEQSEFGQIAYRVMDHAFAIHNEMGRFLDEDIYRDALTVHVGNCESEVRIEVCFQDFARNYFIDLLVDGGAVFELKAAKRLDATHRSQILNYLMLSGLSHGKLVNFRPELVEHEFVNTTMTRAGRTRFAVTESQWIDPEPRGIKLKQWLVEFIKDVGTGLDVRLYESAVTHVCGGEEAVSQPVSVYSGSQQVGQQKMRLAISDWAFKVTTIDDAGLRRFEDHTRRLLHCTRLSGLHWINITRGHVTFSTIRNM
jgi:GxxExxY protein